MYSTEGNRQPKISNRLGYIVSCARLSVFVESMEQMPTLEEIPNLQIPVNKSRLLGLFFLLIYSPVRRRSKCQQPSSTPSRTRFPARGITRAGFLPYGVVQSALDRNRIGQAGPKEHSSVNRASESHRWCGPHQLTSSDKDLRSLLAQTTQVETHRLQLA
jgi:hypothetical protein